MTYHMQMGCTKFQSYKANKLARENHQVTGIQAKKKLKVNMNYLTN